MNRLLFAVLAMSLTGCTSMLVLRGSSNDFLKRKATTLDLNSPVATVQPVLDELFFQRGFRPSGQPVAGDKGSKIIVYKGMRAVPPEAASYGIQLGSWYAARIADIGNGTTEITLMGKPMVGTIEICSDHDNLLQDIQYTCIDTKVPPDWAGKNLVSGRDETEVVSWVLSGLYERLKH